MLRPLPNGSAECGAGIGVGIMPQNLTYSFQLSIKHVFMLSIMPQINVLWYLQIWLKLHVKWGILLVRNNSIFFSTKLSGNHIDNY